MSDKKEAKEKSIVSYLSSQGYKPIKGRSIGRHHVYSSMLHTESNPSFFVDKDRNVWKDFGFSSTKWEDVITLVMRIESKTFPEAIDILLKRRHVRKEEISQEPHKPGIEIVNVVPLTSPILIEYLQDRKVDIDLARLYCEQATARFPRGKNPNKEHLYISFRNDKGGYELRNQYTFDIKKVSSSPKYFTRFIADPNKYNLFEGFMDFLTMLTMYKRERFKNTTVVLNSLVNLLYLYETLRTNEENNLFLDNDLAAQKYIYTGDEKNKIISLKDRDIPFKDQRIMFGHAGDINDYAVGKLII